MGTYAGLLKEDGAIIPAKKRKEFEHRVEKLFQAGGMMEMRYIWLYGKEIKVIKKASMHKYGMDFFYSYFDDCRWENAGFDKEKCHIFSNKVGHVYFIEIILAAYTLESFYMDGPAIATVDDDIVLPRKYANWIYYLFQDDDLLTKVYKDALLVVWPLSTEDFLRISHDDMILYWEEGRSIQFSDELKNWFKELRERFDQIMEKGIRKKKRMAWIVDIMKYADWQYFHIYTIADFFEETREHLGDQRYIALWKIYEEMLHDPQLKKAGSAIFFPDSPEYKDRGIHYPKEDLVRPLRTFWDMMDWDRRNNKARVTFKRYMALVANKELRKKVFGF